MPNYLQRVALAGARTSTPARPPAAGPPLLPSVRMPAPLPVDAAGPEGVPAGSEEVVVRQAKPPPAAPAPPPSEPAARQLPPATRPATSAGAATPREEAVLPRPAAVPPLSLPRPPVEAAAVVRMPRTLRPASPPAPAPPAQLQEPTPARISGPAPPEADVPIAVPAASSGGMPGAVVADIKEPPRQGAGKGAGQRPAETVVQAARGPAAAPRSDQAGPAPPQAAPPRPAASPAPPDVAAPEGRPRGGTERQTRVTIGRLDVEVHNHAPPAPAAPPPADVPAADSLEQRCLEWFRLRP